MRPSRFCSVTVATADLTSTRASTLLERDAGFDLTDAAPPDDSGLPAPGTYEVTEVLPANWIFTSLSADDPCIPGGAGMTLMDALDLQGGAGKALTRHAAAAFLNAERPKVDSYPSLVWCRCTIPRALTPTQCPGRVC